VKTGSNNFPITPGAFQTGLNGIVNVFITKLNSTGSALLYSTYLGGTVVDTGNSIEVDSNGNAYVTGFTQSKNLSSQFN
jgi:hypothetical protein